jgi:hypothetical protein
MVEAFEPQALGTSTSDSSQCFQFDKICDGDSSTAVALQEDAS